MTYKTLRRKSDKQWVSLYKGFPTAMICEKIPTEAADINTPIEYFINSFKEIDWSLYELVEVVVIPVDEFPSEEEIRDSAEKKYPKRNHTKFLQQWDNTLRRLYVEAQMELINKLKGE